MQIHSARLFAAIFRQRCAIAVFQVLYAPHGMTGAKIPALLRDDLPWLAVE